MYHHNNAGTADDVDVKLAPIGALVLQHADSETTPFLTKEMHCTKSPPLKNCIVQGLHI